MAKWCHNCGYDLSGLEEQSCPECGIDLDDRTAVKLSQSNAESAAAFLAVFPGLAGLCLTVLGFIVPDLGVLIGVVASQFGGSARFLFLGMHVLIIAIAYVLFSSRRGQFDTVYRYFAIAIASDLIALWALHLLASNVTL